MTTARVEIRKMRVSDLKPADYNPRKITETAMSGLGESLKRFGMLSHIVWNQRTGNIVGGHQRIRHLIGDGIEETDVVVVDLGEQEEVALNIALNNPMIRGDFTEDVMAQLRQAEAGIGSGFNEIGLMDLFEHLKEQGFGKEKPGNKTAADIPDDVFPSGRMEGGSGPDDQDDGSWVAITCPKCGSQFKAKDNEVVYDSVKGVGRKIGGADEH